jgi:uncharacterized protein with HEPN domain
MKDNKVYLQHIVDSIEEIESFLVNVDWEDTKTERAIERCLEIIGEAASKLPKDFQKQFNQVEWELIIGMRHKIIHDYFDVDMNVVRTTVEEDLPILKEKILEILNDKK